jgi:hypothetical protein
MIAREASMELPSVSDEVWKDLLLKRKTCAFEFLGLKMLLGRLISEVERDPSPDKLEKCAEQLRDLLAKNMQLPSVNRDLQKIIG